VLFLPPKLPYLDGKSLNNLHHSPNQVAHYFGEDFFNKLAKDFIMAHPSETGNIIDYGDEFSNFIKLSPDCKTMKVLLNCFVCNEQADWPKKITTVFIISLLG
jgi:hypothetical protein